MEFSFVEAGMHISFTERLPMGTLVLVSKGMTAICAHVDVRMSFVFRRVPAGEYFACELTGDASSVAVLIQQ